MLEKNLQDIRGARVGLITNPTGVDRHLRSTVDLLFHHPHIHLKALLGPEHGVRGNMQAGEVVSHGVDVKTGLPMISLYGSEKRPSREVLHELDVVIFDVQDIGSRYYTMIYTLAYALEEVQKAGKKMVVLDRPNPIAPMGVQGSRIQEDCTSFVGGYGLPHVHGLTVGELAQYFKQEFSPAADLEVVAMEGWRRNVWFEATPWPWVLPSPNIPTVETAILYTGTCLFEGTNLSEGRGTTKPFELIGAPWIDGWEWARELNSLGLSGLIFRPVHFTPTFSKHEGVQVEGVQVHIVDRRQADPLAAGMAMLWSAFVNYPEFRWIEMEDRYFIDLLSGSTELRKAFSCDVPPTGIMEQWAQSQQKFMDIREAYLLYE